MNDYCIASGYRHRLDPAYTEDTEDSRVVWQPDVYAVASVLADRYGARTIIDIGCGGAKKLGLLAGRFSVVGIDYGGNIEYCRATYPFGRWLTVDFDGEEAPALAEALRSLGPETLADAVVVCSDVIEHLVRPDGLLKVLADIAPAVRACLVSTPERERTHHPGHAGPPPNPCHVREWTLAEFRALLDRFGLPVMHAGLTASHNRGRPKSTILAVIDRNARPAAPPRQERPVTALLVTRDDADHVEGLVGRLHADGIRIHAIDLGSTDGTHELLVGQSAKLAALERIATPRVADDGKLDSFWHHAEDVAASCPGHWMLLLEGNQRAVPTGCGPSLRSALATVEASGFNAVSFTGLDFHPVDGGFGRTLDAEAYFGICSFARSTASRHLTRAWIQPDSHPVGLADTAGCAPLFIGRRDFPYRFLMKSYPKRRFLPADPWLPARIVHNASWGFPPGGLDLIDVHQPDFMDRYLTECVFGVGVLRHDFGL